MVSRVFTVFRDWDGRWAVRTEAEVVIYSTSSQSAAETYAVDQARGWPPSRVRVLRADSSLERVWDHAGEQAARRPGDVAMLHGKG